MPSLPAGRRGGTAMERLQPDNSGRPRSCQPRWALWVHCAASAGPEYLHHKPSPASISPMRDYHHRIALGHLPPGIQQCQIPKRHLRGAGGGASCGRACAVSCAQLVHMAQLWCIVTRLMKGHQSGHGAVSSDRALCI